MRQRKPSEPAKTPAPAPQTAQTPAPPTPRPFKPQKKLFYTLLILFAGWVGMLLALYFTTVYPNRHPAKPTTAATVLTR